MQRGGYKYKNTDFFQQFQKSVLARQCSRQARASMFPCRRNETIFAVALFRGKPSSVLPSNTHGRDMWQPPFIVPSPRTVRLFEMADCIIININNMCMQRHTHHHPAFPLLGGSCRFLSLDHSISFKSIVFILFGNTSTASRLLTQ